MPTPFQRLQKKLKEMELEIRRLKGLDQDANDAQIAELLGNGEDNSERQAGRHTGSGFAAAAGTTASVHDPGPEISDEDIPDF